MASAAEQLAANMNFEAFQKASELHKRLWFTLIALIVYRLGTYIAIPGVDMAAFAKAFEGQSKGILGMFDMFSGGAVARMAIFSLNVMPYISASIIVQILGTVYTPWEKLRKEGGEAGRKTLNQYTRYLTVVLAMFQAGGIAIGLSNSQGAVLNQDSSVNGASNPARRGQAIQIFATGEGQTSPRGITGSVTGSNLKTPVLAVKVTSGGVTAPVEFVGSAPDAVTGLLQVNAMVPQDVTPGPAVPILLAIGNFVSPDEVTIAVK